MSVHTIKLFYTRDKVSRILNVTGRYFFSLRKKKTFWRRSMINEHFSFPWKFGENSIKFINMNFYVLLFAPDKRFCLFFFSKWIFLLFYCYLKLEFFFNDQMFHLIYSHWCWRKTDNSFYFFSDQLQNVEQM